MEKIEKNEKIVFGFLMSIYPEPRKSMFSQFKIFGYFSYYKYYMKNFRAIDLIAKMLEENRCHKNHCSKVSE